MLTEVAIRNAKPEKSAPDYLMSVVYTLKSRRRAASGGVSNIT